VGKALEEKGRAVEEANDSRAQREALQAQHDELARRHESLQRQCASLEQSAELARQAERHAEEKLDASLEHHKHQVALRQAREAELERTVAELGAALTAAQSSAAALTSHSHPGLGPTDGGPSRESLLASLGEYKEKCAAAAEELESAKTELRMMAREREALQRDVKEMSAERDAEAAQAQERQLRHDEQLSQLTAQLQRLQGNATRESSNGIGHAAAKDGGGPADPPLLRQTELELGESRRQIAELSDQLLRLRGIAEASKSEVLALKGRLQAANSRADAAEVALASATTSAYDVEGGGGGSGSKSRRRVKGGLRAFGGGGLSRPSHLAPRSVRAALGLRVVSGSTMEQVALTVDAIDNWMMDTGSILKAEPLARVAFAAYLAILHCWCFALVFFHAVESEHGDLGVLTHRGGPLHPGKK
jgi:chemotaxis protein histidine kinase CheA